MRETLVERRLELLKMEGNGFSQPEITKHLSTKFQVSRRMVQLDFQRRCKWQSLLQESEDVERNKWASINRYMQIYRKACFMEMQSDSDNAKIGALSIQLKAAERIDNILLPRSDKVELMQTQPFIVKMWRPKESAELTTKAE